MTFLILLFCAFGITFGLQHKCPWLYGKLGFIDRMLACTYCTGFHAGWITWILFKVTMGSIRDLPLSSIPEMILLAFGSAGFSYALDALTRYFESNSDPLEEDEDTEP